MMRKITDARSSDVRPFVENIENVNRLYNEPTMLIADEDEAGSFTKAAKRLYSSQPALSKRSSQTSALHRCTRTRTWTATIPSSF